MARGEPETQKAAEEGMAQIVEKEYTARYGGNVVLLALAIDDERRSITEYRMKGA